MELTKTQQKIIKRLSDGWDLRVDSMGAYFKKGFDRILGVPAKPIMDLIHKKLIEGISSPTADCAVYILTKQHQPAPAPAPGTIC